MIEDKIHRATGTYFLILLLLKLKLDIDYMGWWEISVTVKLILLLIHLKLKSATGICHDDVEDYVFSVEGKQYDKTI